MLKLLTKLPFLKTELQNIENTYKEKLQAIEKINKQYFSKLKEIHRANEYLRTEKKILVKKYTLLVIIFWLIVIGNNLLWFMFR